MDTVTRADDVDVFLRIHEYYPDLNDKWVSSTMAPFFLLNWKEKQGKNIFLNEQRREHE